MKNKKKLIVFLILPLITFFVEMRAQNIEELCGQTILLESLDLNKIVQPTGRPHDIGAQANLTISNSRFLNGIHTRAESRLYLELDGNVTEFSAEVGIDNRATAFRNDTVNKEKSTAEFFVIGDGKTLWQSGTMKFGDTAKPVKVALSGVKDLLLKVTGGPGNTHVDWVEAKFVYSGRPPVTVWSPEDQQTIRASLEFLDQQNKKYPTPRINGAMKVGIRTNTPIYYPVAVTGMRPLTYGATGLPEGLVLDKMTGVITGSASRPGEYKVQLTAENDHGKAQRTLRIEVGDKLALTPPMGYMSWNLVEGLVNETFMKETADAFVRLGLRDVGYQYINLDDCWHGTRGSDGRISPDPVKFPNGMKVVGDYLHDKGMKLGIYSTPGPITCAGYPGTMNFEELDLETWMSWGVDYLKYDNCSAPERSAELYGLMGRLLRTACRSVVYLGRKDAGSQLWRTGGDLRDQWSITDTPGGWGIMQSFEQVVKAANMQVPGGWNDPDMLVVGMRGKGSSGNDLSNGKGCTDTEYRSHMSLWALMSAPLFITIDVRHIDPASLEILSNPEVIEVDQDPLGYFPKRLGDKGQQEIWVKEMEDGSKTLALFNKDESSKNMSVSFEDLGLKGKHLVRDLWEREDKGTAKAYSALVPGHGVTLIRVY